MINSITSSVSSFVSENEFELRVLSALALNILFVKALNVALNFFLPSNPTTQPENESPSKPVAFPVQPSNLSPFLHGAQNLKQPYTAVITAISEPNAQKERTVTVQFKLNDKEESAECTYKIVNVASYRDSFGDLSEDAIRELFKKALVAKALPYRSCEITTRWLAEEINRLRKVNSNIDTQLRRIEIDPKVKKDMDQMLEDQEADRRCRVMPIFTLDNPLPDALGVPVSK